MSTINTISTLQKSLTNRQSIADQDRKIAEANKELVTGLKADVYADRSFRAAQTLDLRNRISRSESFATSNKLLSGKLGVTATLMSNMREDVQAFQALALTLGTGNQSRDVLVTEAQSLLKSISAQLNTVYDGEYLFSGWDAAAEPLSLPDNIAEASLPATATAADTAAQIIALDSWFGLNGAPVVTPNFLETAYNGAGARATARVDEVTTIDYGLHAGEEPVRQMLKGLTMIAMTNIHELEDAGAAKAWIETASQALNAGVSGLHSLEITLGNHQSFLNDVITRQETLSSIYNNRVMDIEGVDEYEVATRLEALSTQLEASYAVTVRLKNLSLLNFL